MNEAPIHVRASKEFKDRIRSSAKKEDRTISDWIRSLIIERWMKEDQASK